MNLLSFLFKKKKKIPTLEIYPDAVMVFSIDFELLEYNTYADKLFNLKDKSTEEVKPEDLFD